GSLNAVPSRLHVREGEFTQRGGVTTPGSRVGIGDNGADYSTTYTQTDQTASATTTVMSGTVQVTDVTTGTTTTLTAGQQNTVNVDVPAISIPAQSSQQFVFNLTPTAPIPPTDIKLSFGCAGTTAPTITGLTSLLSSASPLGTPVPDIVALAATATND